MNRSEGEEEEEEPEMIGSEWRESDLGGEVEEGRPIPSLRFDG